MKLETFYSLLLSLDTFRYMNIYHCVTVAFSVQDSGTCMGFQARSCRLHQVALLDNELCLLVLVSNFMTFTQ
jgi:hypothetical protein